MNKKSILYPLFALAFSASAQIASDPVLMTVNGKSIHKSEFEYSYHKNGGTQGADSKMTVEEYVPMFVNYKLKVAAAEAAHLDTLPSFRREYLTYRDAQLTPYMIDYALIDSIARDTYDRTVTYLNGKDLFESAHILIRVRQNENESAKNKAKAKADSIYNVLLSGADFEEMARKYSNDSGSARNGGHLSLAGPGTFIPEFENAAYALQSGEISKPVLSPFGYHIIKMIYRKRYGTYEEMKPEIMASLKKQNIEEYSSEVRIDKIVEASKGKLTREAVLDSVLNAEVKNNAQLRCLVQEYYDGLLLYEVSKRQVWDVAANDSVGLEKFFKKNKKSFKWKNPHFKGYVFHCQNKKQAKSLKKILKKYGDTKEWRPIVKEMFNKDSVTVSVSGPYLCTEGENPFVDAYVFKVNKTVSTPKKFVMSGVCGRKMKQPQSYLDIKTRVTNEYQKVLEDEWVKSLRRKFTYTIKEDVLKNIK